MIIRKSASRDRDHARGRARHRPRAARSSARRSRRASRRRELDEIAEEVIRSRGRRRRRSRATMASRRRSARRVNEQVVHGIPGDRRLAEGDILSVDVGAIVDGYYGDCGAHVPGRATSATRPHGCWTSRERALEAGIAQCVAGHAALRHRRTRCRRSPRARASRSCASTSGTGSAGRCTRSRRSRTTAPAGKGPTLQGGHGARDRADGERGRRGGARSSQDGWTVVTADGSPFGALRAHGRDHRRRARSC